MWRRAGGVPPPGGPVEPDPLIFGDQFRPGSPFRNSLGEIEWCRDTLKDIRGHGSLLARGDECARYILHAEEPCLPGVKYANVRLNWPFGGVVDSFRTWHDQTK